MSTHEDDNPFLPASNLFRSPPINTTDETKSVCKVCHQVTGPNKAEVNDDWIECEKCKSWFHWVCVGVNAVTAQLAWKCHSCSADKASVNSKRSSTVRRKQALIEANRLQQEVELRRKQMEEQLQAEDMELQAEDMDSANLQ